MSRGYGSLRNGSFFLLIIVVLVVISFFAVIASVVVVIVALGENQQFRCRDGMGVVVVVMMVPILVGPAATFLFDVLENPPSEHRIGVTKVAVDGSLYGYLSARWP